MTIATVGIVSTTTVQPAAASTTTKLIQVNGTASAITLAAPGDSAVLSFQAVVGQVLGFSGTAGTFADNCDATLTVRSPSGTTIAPATCVGQSGALTAVTAHANGIFTATIESTGASVGTLQFQVTSTAAKRSITPNAPELAVAVDAGATVNLVFSAGLGRYVAAYARDNTDCASSFRIVRPDGVDQFAPTCASGNSGVFVDQTLVTVAGNHKLRIVNTATSSRTVFVQVFSGRNATANTTIDGPTSTFTFLPAQQARVSFPVNAGQSFRIAISPVGPTSSGSGTCATLFEPDGTDYGHDCTIGALSGSTAPAIPDTLADHGGTWTVLLDPNVMGTPSFDIRVVSIADPTALVLDGAPHDYAFVPERGPLPLHFELGANQYLRFDGVNAGPSCPLGTDCTIRMTFVDPTGSPEPGGGLQWPAGRGLGFAFDRSPAGRWVITLSAGVRRTVTIQASVHDDVVVDQDPLHPASSSFAGGGVDQRLVIRFAATAGHHYALTSDLLVQITSPNPSVDVFSPSAAVSILAGVGFRLDAAETGTYRVVITPARSRALGAFHFMVGDTTTPLRVAVTPGTASPEVDPVLDQSVDFTFSGTAGQKISTTAETFVFEDDSASVVFLRPNGTPLGPARTITASRPFLDPVRLDATGEWTVRLSSFCPRLSGCAVRLKLTDVPDVTGLLLVEKTKLPFTIALPGQVGRFTFKRSAGLTFRVHFTGSTFSGAAVSVMSPLGAMTTLCTLGSGTLDCPVRTAPLSGTYTIIVDPPLEQVGSATITISS